MRLSIHEKTWFLFSLLSAVCISFCSAVDLEKLPFLRVISIHDGDSIRLLTEEKEQLKIRLDGIDAPEIGQDFGTKSKKGLGAILKRGGEFVYMDKTGVDRYGRTLAKLYLKDGSSVDELMIKGGFAWHFKKYNSEANLDQAEKEARRLKRGLWGIEESPMSPWDYRSRKRELSKIKKERKSESIEKKSTKVDAQKYWINGGSKKRHNKGCRWHGNTKRGYYSSKPEGVACKICGG